MTLRQEGRLQPAAFDTWIRTALGTHDGDDARILRAKGHVALHGQETRLNIQATATRLSLHPGEQWREKPAGSLIVLIGSDLDEAALATSFAACAEPEAAR